MRAYVVFGLMLGMGAAGACSSFSAVEDVTDASADDGSTGPEDSSAADAADGSDALAPLIRWSFETNGSASTGVLGDTIFPYADAGYRQGVVGSGLHCPPGAYAETAATGTPFEIGRGDATFVVWVQLDPGSETPDAADRFHTFFDRNMNWAASQGGGAGYGIGYVHRDIAPFLQAALTDSAGKFTSVSAKVQLYDGVFHMVAFVVSQDALSLYSDGQIIGTKPLARANPIGIGPDAGPIRLCDIYSNFLRGSLDELMIFPRALGPTEIAQLRRDVEGN